MSTSQLLKFTFSCNGNKPAIPLIPIRFIDKNGQPTPIFNAILDSGADELTIPKALSDLLKYELRLRSDKIHTAGGEIEAFSTVACFNIGRGDREVKYTNVDICVVDQDMPVLIGIKPIFEDYKVIIMAYQNKFKLEPKK